MLCPKKNDAKIDAGQVVSGATLKIQLETLWWTVTFCHGKSPCLMGKSTMSMFTSWISENYTATPPGKAKQMPPWSRCCPCEPPTVVVASELIKVTSQNLLVESKVPSLCLFFNVRNLTISLAFWYDCYHRMISLFVGGWWKKMDFLQFNTSISQYTVMDNHPESPCKFDAGCPAKKKNRNMS